MKILQVNKFYSPVLGGIETIVKQVAEGLDAEVLVCRKKGGRKIEDVNGIRVYRASSLGVFWGMPLSFDFFRLFKKLRNNILDIHHPFPLADLAVLLFPPKKLVVHYHSDIVRQKIFLFLLRPFIMNTLKQADKIIVSNPNLVKTSEFLKEFKHKCVVIPFGVKKETFERVNTQEVKKQYGEFVFFAGRHNYYKGLNYLLSAFKDIDANLVLVGEGEKKKDLQKQAAKLGIQDKVFFLTFQDDLRPFFQAASVFVLPSIFRSEAFGIVLIEAMASGTPLVSTEIGTGTSWVNQNGKTGFVVPPKNEKLLSQAINYILHHEDLREQFSRNCVLRAQEEFTLEGMISKLNTLFEEEFE